MTWMRALPTVISSALCAVRFIVVATGCSAASVEAIQARRSSANASCPFAGAGDSAIVGPIVVQAASTRHCMDQEDTVALLIHAAARCCRARLARRSPEERPQPEFHIA